MLINKFLVGGGPSLPHLIEEVNKGDNDYMGILHAGDFAYNLYTDEGRMGDGFFHYIEPLAAYLPYMTCPGNHEIEYLNPE